MIRKTLLLSVLATALALGQQTVSPEKESSLKGEIATQIDGMKKQAQVMVDSVFSFGELGFQEFETTKYLTGILEKEGFRIERGVAGIPTAFTATSGPPSPHGEGEVRWMQWNSWRPVPPRIEVKIETFAGIRLSPDGKDDRKPDISIRGRAKTLASRRY